MQLRYLEARVHHMLDGYVDNEDKVLELLGAILTDARVMHSEFEELMTGAGSKLPQAPREALGGKDVYRCAELRQWCTAELARLRSRPPPPPSPGGGAPRPPPPPFSPCAVAAPPSGQAPPGPPTPGRTQSQAARCDMLLDELRRLDRRLGALVPIVRAIEEGCAELRSQARGLELDGTDRAGFDEAERALFSRARAVLAAIGPTEASPARPPPA